MLNLPLTLTFQLMNFIFKFLRNTLYSYIHGSKSSTESWVRRTKYLRQANFISHISYSTRMLFSNYLTKRIIRWDLHWSNSLTLNLNNFLLHHLCYTMLIKNLKNKKITKHIKRNNCLHKQYGSLHLYIFHLFSYEYG